MAEMFKMVVVKDEWKPLIKKLGSRAVQKTLGEIGNDIAHKVKDNLIKASKWDSITKTIQVGRRGNINTVSMANKGILLDRMTPHYVSLKRGRNITKWAMMHSSIGPNGRRHLNKRKSGRSHIQSGSRGGITGGAIYVTPTPWIDAPVKKALRSNKRIVSRHINRLLKSAKIGG